MQIFSKICKWIIMVFFLVSTIIILEKLGNTVPEWVIVILGMAVSAWIFFDVKNNE